MSFVVCIIVIVAASCLVPHVARARWRRAWISEVWHYNTLLRDRGMPGRYVAKRIWHHSHGAVRDAWRLRREAPGTSDLRAAVRKPWFSLSVIAAVFVAIIAGSRGLAITRAMISPSYADVGQLVLISETGGLLGERYLVPAPLLDYWKAHTRSFAGLAGYQWNSRGTAWVTPGFFDVLGTRPGRFLLRRIHAWKPVSNQQPLGVIGRLKPGVSRDEAETDLRDLEARYWHYAESAPTQQAELSPLLDRLRHPLYSYDFMCMLTAALLLAAAGFGMRADRRRGGRVRLRYWAYFCAKSVALPLAVTLVIFEFTRATSFTFMGTPAFIAEPYFAWLVILACGAIAWWCLADQRTRCRACVQTLQYPVRIGSLGAVLFDHAGTELVCCEGHGSLYVPAMCSDYVQRGGWTSLDSADVPPEPARR